MLSFPAAVAPTPGGGYLIADAGNQRVRFVTPDGVIFTVAGNGGTGAAGDGGPATAAELNHPTGVAPLPDGGFVIADSGNDRVRKVDVDGTITTLAGTGEVGFFGDHGPATSARLDEPTSVSVTPGGAVLIADRLNDRVRRVSPTGVIDTVAGGGTMAPASAFGPSLGSPTESLAGTVLATQLELSRPAGVAATPDGGFLLSDSNHDVVFRVNYGIATKVAGIANPGFGGDGGPAPAAALATPTGLTALPDGGVAIADRDNQRIRRVNALSGAIETVAGGPQPGFADSPTASAGGMLAYPNDVAALPTGDLLVADTSTHRIRLITHDGQISTIAGSGSVPPVPRPAIVNTFVFQVDPTRLRTRKGCSVEVRAFSSTNSAMTVSVAPRHGVLAPHGPMTLSSGKHPVRLRVRLRPGSYRLRFVAQHLGQVRPDAAGLRVRHAGRCR